MASRLFPRMLAPLAGVAVLSAFLSGAAAIAVMDRLYGDSTAEAMERAASGLAAAMPTDALYGTESAPAARLAEWAAAASAASLWRVTVIRADGSVAADSSADPARMENHAGRPEVASALAGRAASARRRSGTLGRELFYAAVPLPAPAPGMPAAAPSAGGALSGTVPAGRIPGALRVSADLPAVEARLAPARWVLAMAALLVAAISTLAAILFSRDVARPIQALAGVARSLSSGERGGAIPVAEGPEEVRDLARALASMSDELARRVREAEAEGRERAAILDGMAEAVLALDRQRQVRLANPAARSLFGMAEGDAPFGSLLAVTRSAELEAAAQDCIESGRSLEIELAIYGEPGPREGGAAGREGSAPGRDGEPQPRAGEPRQGGGRWFQAFVAPLSGSNGAVIVLNDITRLRSLERVRRDFVANVSHELRTPIQLIKGFTEALSEGAMDDPVQARRFLDIMGGNAARMESLVDDLLTLARLEQEGQDWLQCEVHELDGLVDEAVEAVLPKAEAKDITIVQACAEGLEARLNAGLFVQAVVNLVDNAVKYSPRGSRVTVSARPERAQEGDDGNERVLVTVADQGIGIPVRDLPRIFERFYRVDKARSKELGGTGLGLAIVRHIALAHGGSVSVESAAGEGTRFFLRLPVAGPPSPKA